MKRIWLLVVSGALALAVLGLYGCAPGPAIAPGSTFGINLGSQQEGLWVNGKGEVMAVPDIANVNLGIQAQAATVAEAQSQAVKAMTDVMAVLIGNGVAAKDIQTQTFNIQQLTRYDQNKQQNVVIGYQVTNTVNAKIRALDRVGAIIDAVAKAGGDLTRINGISFTVDDPTPYQNDARQKAMADAKAKADQMAGLAGVRLGKPKYITESSYLPPIPVPMPIMRAEAAAPAAPTPISPGETRVTVNVQIVYPILP
ncbi:MAG: SIMPL domain-containing protein [Chloroflexi bacterium]|nr:SIMPL domain-containing protein [Chloroflexota bacterium]